MLWETELIFHMPALYLTRCRAPAAGAVLSMASVIINMLRKLGETGKLELKEAAPDGACISAPPLTAASLRERMMIVLSDFRGRFLSS